MQYYTTVLLLVAVVGIFAAPKDHVSSASVSGDTSVSGDSASHSGGSGSAVSGDASVSGDSASHSGGSAASDEVVAVAQALVEAVEEEITGSAKTGKNTGLARANEVRSCKKESAKFQVCVSLSPDDERIPALLAFLNEDDSVNESINAPAISSLHAVAHTDATEGVSGSGGNSGSGSNSADSESSVESESSETSD